MSKSKLRKVTQTLFPVRYTTAELEEFITEEFYKELATSKKVYFLDKVSEYDQIRPRVRFELRKQRIKDIQFRINDYKRRLAEEETDGGVAVFQRGIDHLTQRLELEKDFTYEKQKKIYAETGDVFNSRSFTEFPLNKKINALYDDFNALVLYYDNLTNEEVISALENAETIEEKVQIVKDNVEITHIALPLVTSNRASIAVKGKFDPVYSDIKNSSAQVLPIRYSDFNKVTLKMCESIKNNDLAQIIQERIELDKEELIEEACLTIKGEDYKILKSPHTSNEYIRYVCPSTQRVYYNVLNHEFLEQSNYYKKGNAESYIKSWYSIANLFIELSEEEMARPSIAC